MKISNSQPSQSNKSCLFMSCPQVGLTFICLLAFILFNFKTYSQATLTHTTDEDFNRGYFTNAKALNGDIVPEHQAYNIGEIINYNGNITQKLEHHAAVGWNNHIFISGGFEIDYNDTIYSDKVYVASASNNGVGNWGELFDLPEELCDHAMIIANGYLYVLGGHRFDVLSDRIYYAKVFADNTITEWQLSEITLPEPIWGHQVVFVNGHLYISGGSNKVEEESATDAVYVTTPQPDGSVSDFSTLTSLPEVRNRHSLVSDGNHLIVLGGQDENGDPQNTVFFTEVDIEGNMSSWEVTDPLPAPLYRHSAIFTNGIIATFAGHNPDDPAIDYCYYAEASSLLELNWQTVTTFPPIYLSDGLAVVAGDRIYYTGGSDIFHNTLNEIHYCDIELSAEHVSTCDYISPVFDLGDNRTIDELFYNHLNVADTSFVYRYAGNGETWSDWSIADSSFIEINQSKRYLQYALLIDSIDAENLPAIEDVNLSFFATQVCGTLNGSLHWTTDLSPYLVTCDIFLESGSLNIDAGVNVIFAPETQFEIGQASLFCNGTESQPITFTSFDGTTGSWKGLYFNENSDNGVFSELNYVVIEKAGVGESNNLYCYNTSQPTLNNCFVSNCIKNGIFLENSTLEIYNTNISLNRENGVQIDNSGVILNNCNIFQNGLYGIYGDGDNVLIFGSFISENENGVYFSGGSPSINQCTINSNMYNGIELTNSTPTFINVNMSECGNYAIFYNSINCNSLFYNLTLENNLFNGVAVPGGTISYSREWRNPGYPYYILGDVTIAGSSKPRLSIEKGNILKFSEGKQMIIGKYDYYGNLPGELFAEGTSDSLIVFTSMNDSVGGWNGIYFTDYSDLSGAISLLNGCLIERAIESNIYCYKSSQPTIDSCILSNSKKYGVNLDNSSISISNSMIVYNQDHGIYLSGSSQPTIGNTPETGCDLYFNGDYDIYNNTNKNIDARYNYWKSTDSSYIASRVYDHFDNASKGIVYFMNPDSIGLHLADFPLSGNITYDNDEQDVLDEVKVYAWDYLYNKIDSTTTDENGFYHFDTLSYGKYIFDIEPDLEWGGVNSTDALLIMKHFAMLETLEGVRKDASDVNWSHTINATDALLVMKRYANVTNSFPAGDWLVGLDTLMIDGRTDTIHDFKALCYGDVNGSYTFTLKNDSEIILEYNGVIPVASFQEFELPIDVCEFLQIGAISLELFVPAEYLEVLDVTTPIGNSVWSVNGNNLRIAWADLNPLILNEMETLVTLHLKSRNLENLTEPIYIVLSPDGELADGDALPYENVVLNTSLIEPITTGINVIGKSGFFLGDNFPNPFKESTTISYIIPDAGYVKLSLFNVMGEPVEVLINENKMAGKNTVTFNDANLKPGIYYYKIEVKCSNAHFQAVKEMIKTK